MKLKVILLFDCVIVWLSDGLFVMMVLIVLFLSMFVVFGIGILMNVIFFVVMFFCFIYW